MALFARAALVRSLPASFSFSRTLKSRSLIPLSPIIPKFVPFRSFSSTLVQASNNSRRWSSSNSKESKLRCLAPVSSSTAPSKDVSIEVPIIIDEDLKADSILPAVIEQLEVDAPLAVKLAISNFEDFDLSEVVELSVLLCDDARIRELNKEWRQKDAPTDVLSFPQDQPLDGAPLLLLGDVVISIETAARQAQERGHSLLDELRILLVHGLLHVLDYDHELGPEASKEMEDEENRIVAALGWQSKGLIRSQNPNPIDGDTAVLSKTKFRILFCDMDGTLLNSKSFITPKTADALRAAMEAGVTVIIATGKTRPAAIAALSPVGLAGSILSESTPGVFLQGLQVFGKNGKVLQNITLDSSIVGELFKFSLEHEVPLVGFTGDRCVTLFSHPLIDELHEVYYEPKAEVLHSIDEVKKVPIQKVIYLDTAERVATFLRPHWSLALRGRATVVQALPEMMEVLPSGISKGLGVELLLKHLDVNVDEVMALGDGENDIEMLSLAGWGVAMSNGAARTLAVANAVTGSNDEDGVATAIEKYIL